MTGVYPGRRKPVWIHSVSLRLFSFINCFLMTTTRSMPTLQSYMRSMEQSSLASTCLMKRYSTGTSLLHRTRRSHDAEQIIGPKRGERLFHLDWLNRRLNVIAARGQL